MEAYVRCFVIWDAGWTVSVYDARSLGMVAVYLPR